MTLAFPRGRDRHAEIFIVWLSDAERATLHGVIRWQKGSALKVRRAQILLKVDAAGPKETNAKIVEAFGCRR